MTTLIPLSSARASSTLPPTSQNSPSHLIPCSQSTSTTSSNGWYSIGLRDYKGRIDRRGYEEGEGNEEGYDGFGGHWLEVQFKGSWSVHAVGVQYQGGFVGRGGSLSFLCSDGNCTLVDEDSYGDGTDFVDSLSTNVPKNLEADNMLGRDEWDDFVDDNSLQVVTFTNPTNDVGKGANGLKMTWDDTTDMYGRIIVYKVKVWGSKIVGEGKDNEGEENASAKMEL
mmetsp:Transcript_5078/g.10141  ORF Transcript_5078/g.10141 Transcript_5078/m.10141 type:complete len:225 (-) Transcript_5078:18-692(-)